MSLAAHTGKSWLIKSVLGCLLAAVLSYAAVLAPTAKAGSIEFCQYVALAPNGQALDRCWGPSESRLAIVGVKTYERAGCVTYASPTNVLQDSWFCIGSNNYGTRYVRNDGASHKGVIRNNNLNYWGRFTGTQTCCF